MRDVDRQRSHGTQYERMLAEYAEFVSAARAKLTRDSHVYVDGLGHLQQQLSSLSVKHLAPCSCILLHIYTRILR